MIDRYLNLYLTTHLTIAVSFFTYKVLEKPLKGVGLKFGFSLRLVQCLFLFSLIVPFIAKTIPLKTGTPLSSEVIEPLAEMGSSIGERISRITPQIKESIVSKNVSNQIWNPLSMREWVVLFLAFSVFIAFGRRVLSLFHLRKLLAESIAIKNIGKVVIATSIDVSVPLSVLIFGKAWIVLPESMLAKWKDVRIAIKHELQHHRQRDTVWTLWFDLLSAVFVLNPFISLWRRTLCELQEFSCDEALIGRKVSSYEYGSCLVRVAEAALETSTKLVGTTSMASGFENPTYFKSFLRRRIEMLAQHSLGRPCFLKGVIIGTVTMLTTVVFAFGAEHLSGHIDSNAIGAGTVSTDPEIQKIADKALEAALKRHKASLGFVVVSDPNTGRLLAVANQDNSEVHAERTPHWALSLKVGPASISKALVAAYAVDKGKTTFDEVHNCENSKYLLAGKKYSDWKPFDKLTTAETVIHSSNICGIKVGQKLGATGLIQAFKDYGFGPGGTAENFPESRAGEIAANNEDEHFVATVSTGYGGMYLTPVELVQAFSAIANGGKLLKPQSGKETERPSVIRRVLSEDTARQTREVLEGVMLRGTAVEAKSSLYRLGGKTATGYSRTHTGHDTLGGESNIASFIGFGPVESPRVVIYVAVENPTDRKGVHGSYHAAPVFREVAEKTLEYLKVPRKLN